jgi:hypothetical protein
LKNQVPVEQDFKLFELCKAVKVEPQLHQDATSIGLQFELKTVGEPYEWKPTEDQLLIDPDPVMQRKTAVLHQGVDWSRDSNLAIKKSSLQEFGMRNL